MNKTRETVGGFQLTSNSTRHKIHDTLLVYNSDCYNVGANISYSVFVYLNLNCGACLDSDSVLEHHSNTESFQFIGNASTCKSELSIS